MGFRVRREEKDGGVLDVIRLEKTRTGVCEVVGVGRRV